MPVLLGADTKYRPHLLQHGKGIFNCAIRK